MGISLILIFLGIKQPEGIIHFKIEDAYTGYSIPCEIKVLKNGNLKLKIKTEGEHVFSLPEGKYSFQFNSENYLPLETYFYITPKENLKVIVYLSPLNKENIFPPEIEGLTGIRGYVSDERGNPLKNVEVIFKGKNLKTLTDEKGIFEFWVEVHEKEYLSPEDVPRDTIILNLKGYKTLKREILLIPENLILKIRMKKGIGEEIIPEIRGKGTGENLPSKDEFRGEFEGKIEENILRTVLDPPPTIRVGKPCSCWTCYNVVVMSLEYYVSSGLDDEWIASWGQHTLRAGAIPYRSYGTYYVINPYSPNYDICDNTCCQVWDGNDIYASCTLAAYITNGILLEKNSNYARSEYSAENNNCGCGDGYSGTGTTWPCIEDPVCAGTSCYGHGRGMCQWGSRRWAYNQGRLWKWIINHYYEPGNMHIASPMKINSISVSQNQVEPGDTFIIYYIIYSYCEKMHGNILLGASLYNPNVGFIDDPPDDLLVTLPIGASTRARKFIVPNNAPYGIYDLWAALWVDVNEDASITGNDLDLYLFILEDAISIQPVKVEEKLPPNFSLISNSSKKFGFLQISPNIISQIAEITFSIPSKRKATLEIFDIKGSKVLKIFERDFDKGIYKYLLNTKFLKSGIYFLVLNSDKGEKDKRKIEILR
ncbi:MAG: SpoIID/LytB domain-containing protein [Candidatus Hydrothermales bacterium]